MAGANLGHQRFGPNAVNMLTRMVDGVGLSLSAAFGSGLRKSAHRLFSKGAIDLQSGHVERTVGRCGGYEMVLVASDTTEVSYGSHPSKQGMGMISPRVRGVNMHTALAMTCQGEPLGLVGQYIFAPEKSKSGRQGPYRHQLPLQDKESWKWVSVLDKVSAAFATSSTTALVVGDRESDFYDYFTRSRGSNIEILSRVRFPKRKVRFLGRWGQLSSVPSWLEVSGQYRFWVPEQKNRLGRWANMAVRYTAVECPAPTNRKGHTCPLWLVHVVEEPLAGQALVEEPLEWYLLTTLAIQSFEAALDMIEHYTKRWVIERFHYVLKSGMRIEKCQIDTFTRLKNALELYSIAAWRVLWLAYVGKVKPLVEARLVFEPLGIDLLERLNGKKIVTVGDYLLSLGKLVGFSPSKQQPLPGEKLLWQAHGILSQIERGFGLAGGGAVGSS